MVYKNLQWKLVSKPIGMVQPSDVELVESNTRALLPGEVLIKNIFVSLDPGLLVYMSSTQEIAGGIVHVGDVVKAWAVGRVVESRSDKFPVGVYVRDHYGDAGIQQYSALHEADVVQVDPGAVPLSAQLGVLGMPALTAYFGMCEIGHPKPGETVVISGASGAVGSVAGQIARIKGCRVVGLAGGPEKCKYVIEELGFDDCIDYKNVNIEDSLLRSCSAGIDIYFDNTGGDILDACLANMSMGGRIIFCGAVAEYGKDTSKGLTNYISVLTRGLKWQGLAFHNYKGRYEPAIRELEGWARDGLMKHREDIQVGIENFLPAFYRLFEGKNFGKLVLKVGDDG